MSTLWEILEMEAARLRSQVASPTRTICPPAPTSASVRTDEIKTPLDEADVRALKSAAIEAELAYMATVACAGVMRHGTPAYYSVRRAELKAQKVMQDAQLRLKEVTKSYGNHAADRATNKRRTHMKAKSVVQSSTESDASPPASRQADQRAKATGVGEKGSAS